MTGPDPDVATPSIMVDTPVGEGRLLVAGDVAGEAPTLLLGHGASGGLNAADLTAVAKRLPDAGVRVVLVQQPWKTAGRKVAAPAPTLDRAWHALYAEATRRWPGPVVVGGRSSGARVACRTADVDGAAGVVCLSFPLHPPGRPEKSRLAELLTPTIPVLVCQGSRDTFGGYDELTGHLAEQPDAANVTVVEIAGADHGMKVRKADDDPPGRAIDLVVASVREFVTAVV
ncbi:alpha/beta family hydrolase [Propionibacteriaceae bacterium Y2011]